MTQTSARHRAFNFQRGTTDDTAPEELAEVDPVYFEIGVPLARIDCVDYIDGYQLLLFTGVMGPGNSGAARSKAMTEFIQLAVRPESYEAFLEGCQSGGVDIEGVGEICAWLSDIYAERPTKSARSSSAGQTSTGSSSAASSPSPESTGAPSPAPTS